jgi:hypothetical protein
LRVRKSGGDCILGVKKEAHPPGGYFECDEEEADRRHLQSRSQRNRREDLLRAHGRCAFEGVKRDG